MRSPISALYFVLLFAGFHEVRPQSTCEQGLAAAERSYESANFDEALARLSPCLNNGDSDKPEMTSKVYRLLSHIHIATDSLARARAAVVKLLAVDPHYQPDPNVDRPEFIDLINQFKPPPTESKISSTDSLQMKGGSPDMVPAYVYDPRRLYLTPDASALPSLEINAGLGTDFFNSVVKDNYQSLPPLWHLRFGLGEIAELEFSSVEILNDLKDGRSWLMGGAFKLSSTENKPLKGLPAFAVFAQFSSSFLRKDEIGNYEYKKDLWTLLFIVSKSFGRFRLHGGWGSMIPGFSITDTGTGRPVSFRRDEPKSESDTSATIIHAPHNDLRAGLQWRVDRFATLMMEYSVLAQYDLNQIDSMKEQSVQEAKSRLKTQEVLIVGVRFFPLNWVAFDAGMMRRLGVKKDDANPFSLRLGLNIGFSIKKWFRTETQQ